MKTTLNSKSNLHGCPHLTHSKLKLSLILLLILLPTMLTLTGCFSKLITKIYDDDTKIASTSNTYNLINPTQNIDGDHFTGSVQLIEGMDTIWTYKASEETTLTITYLFNVTKGQAKLVLIDPDDKVTTLIEKTPDADADATDVATSTFTVKKGKNRIKLVAATQTSLDFDFTLSEGRFEKLGQ